jgi:hypothetical protein
MLGWSWPVLYTCCLYGSICNLCKEDSLTHHLLLFVKSPVRIVGVQVWLPVLSLITSSFSKQY